MRIADGPSAHFRAESYDKFFISCLPLLRFGMSAFDTCLNQIGLAFMPRKRLMLLRYAITSICPMVVFFYQLWSLIVVLFDSSVHCFLCGGFLKKMLLRDISSPPYLVLYAITFLFTSDVWLFVTFALYIVKHGTIETVLSGLVIKDFSILWW